MTWVFSDHTMPSTQYGSRPYPNVWRSGPRAGWSAAWERRGRKIHLGTFDTPEAARQAVLIAQAGHLEYKADIYRDRAARYRTVNNAAAAQQEDVQAEKLEAKAARFRTEADWLGERVAP